MHTMTDNPRKVEAWISRRRFLTGAAAAAGYLAISPGRRLLGAAQAGLAPQGEPVPRVFLPMLARQARPRPKVVHVHDSDATQWDSDPGAYGDRGSQTAVDKLVDRGVMELTGTTTRAAAWQALIPAYAPGQRIAIKVNLNNASSTGDDDNIVDALAEPVNSVVQGLVDAGVNESDIWVYDAVRSIPDRFQDGCDFPGVNFSGRDVNAQGFSTTQKVTFDEPSGAPSLPDQAISQVLVGAHYLINMPIMKKHGHAYVTLSFKNHFGSIQWCGELHELTFPYTAGYQPEYSPMVDIYRNPHFGAKTVLTIGDGLYGSWGNQSSTPAPWGAFGDEAPNSMLFSLDPVAIDCVMYDFLEAEAGVTPGADDYLVAAAREGLGVYEHRAPDASGHEEWYNLIDYVYLDLDTEPAHSVS
jgi:uncharacterized protein (DUF362 family)